MWLIGVGIVIGFFIGRMKWSRNFRFVKIVQFDDTGYAVRCGALGMYVYRNFSDRIDFNWHCKLSDYFTSACITNKETCEKYMSGNLGENVVN